MHLIVAFYASPKKIAMLEELVNQQLFYPFEGEMIGYTRPFLSRLPGGLFDIRCKEEIAPLVLRDINATFCANEKPSVFFKKWFVGEQESKLSLVHTQRMSRKLYFLVRFIRFCTGLKDVRRADGPMQIPLIGWHYCFFIGAWPDAKNAKGHEVL